MAIIIRSAVVPTLAEFGDWESWDGGELDIQTTDHYPAGSNTPDKLQGPHTVTDVTLTRAYDPTRDDAVEDWFIKYTAGKERPRPLTINYKNQQGVIVKTKSFGVCKPKNVARPNGKAGDGAPSEFKIVLSVQGLN